MREKHKEDNEKNDKTKDKQNILNTIITNSTISQYPEDEMKELIDSMIQQVKSLAEANNVDLTTLISYYYGLQTEDDFKDYISNYVENYIRQKMIIVAIAAAENIDVTEEEYEARKKELMDSYSITDDNTFNQYYAKEDVYYVVLADKVSDYVYEHAVIDNGSNSDNQQVQDMLTSAATTETATEASSEETSTEAK